MDRNEPPSNDLEKNADPASQSGEQVDVKPAKIDAHAVITISRKDLNDVTDDIGETEVRYVRNGHSACQASPLL